MLHKIILKLDFINTCKRFKQRVENKVKENKQHIKIDGAVDEVARISNLKNEMTVKCTKLLRMPNTKIQ